MVFLINELYTFKPYIKRTIIRKEKENIHILLNPKGKLLKINNSGKQIINLCNGENNVNQIINFLENEFKIDRNLIERDVILFLDNLKICHFLE